jgi:hypothetical protein
MVARHGRYGMGMRKWSLEEKEPDLAQVLRMDPEEVVKRIEAGKDLKDLKGLEVGTEVQLDEDLIDWKTIDAWAEDKSSADNPTPAGTQGQFFSPEPSTSLI